MEKILDLYTYLLNNKDLKDQLVEDEKKFVENEEMLLSGIGILDNVIEKMVSFDKKYFINEYIKNTCNKFEIIDEYLINKYGQINGYIVYDILKNEYQALLISLKELLNL